MEPLSITDLLNWWDQSIEFEDMTKLLPLIYSIPNSGKWAGIITNTKSISISWKNKGILRKNMDLNPWTVQVIALPLISHKNHIKIYPFEWLILEYYIETNSMAPCQASPESEGSNRMMHISFARTNKYWMKFWEYLTYWIMSILCLDSSIVSNCRQGQPNI